MQRNSRQRKNNTLLHQIIWLVAGLGAAMAICLACGLVGLVGWLVLDSEEVSSGVADLLATSTPTVTPTLTPTTDPASWTPTPTRTPAPTPTITSTPPGSTPVAVESAEGWSFEGVRVQPQPDKGWLLVYGEAINESGQSQAILGIQGTFYNAGGQTITPEDFEDYWPIETLPDGQRMPFELTLYGPTAVDRVELQISTEPGNEALRTGLEITDLDGHQSEGDFCVIGQVRRPDPPVAEYAMVAAVLYDDGDRVINWGIGYELAEAFEGQESVQIGACAEHYNNVVARYELRAWGE